MLPQEIDKILERYLRNECTPEERLLVEKWFDSIGQNRELDARAQLAVQKKLWSRLDTTAPKNYSYWKLGRIAAALLFLVVSSFLIVDYFHSSKGSEHELQGAVSMVTFANTAPDPKRIEMKDGSVIWLQKGSEVKIPEVFHDKREVYLSGEAFFEVTRNANLPFMVYANEVTTKVLGTSFLVKAYRQDKEVTVAVKTGKVSVSAAGAGAQRQKQEEIVVTPNQQIVYDRNENLAMKMLVDEPQVIAQQPPVKASFNNAPVVEIFQALEKRYGISIQYDADVLSACTLTYADITEEGLFEQIEIICNALGARYKRSEFSILIEAKGCK